MNEVTGLDVPAHEAPRRRYLTILFSDLSDSTKIAGSLEAEDYCELLNQLRDIYHRVIAKHDGAIAQFSGDGMLAIFGYPETREGDGRRAVEAALDLHDAVRGLGVAPRRGGPELRLHSGIHSGLVLLHSGDQVRGRFEVLGSATNIASRLCGLAGPGQILVSAASLGPERHLFDTSARGHLRLKGKEEPVATLAILGRAPVGSRYAASVRGGLTPFVGRKAELKSLTRGLDDAVAGTPRFIEIEGPAGVGKTRLAEELLRRGAERGCRIYRGECDAAAEALQPFLQIARSALGLTKPVPKKQGAKLLESVLAGIDPALLNHLPALLRLLSLSRDLPAEGATAALCALIDRLAAGGPLILFIDDWHWADDASREILAALRGLDRRAILVLVTARPGSPADRRMADLDILPLGPFTEAETGEAVTRLLPSPDPFVVADIRASSGGNALFIEELCHSIASGQQDDGAHRGNPWLDILIESRFSRLPEEQADLVRAAAVIGNVIPSWLLELIAGCGEKDPRLAGLAEEDFIFPGERDGTLRFKHGITRDAIYESVGLHERRALHLHIAEALRNRGPEHGEGDSYEALAYHYGAGGDAAATAHYAELAADKAVTVSALDRAQAQYRAALAALDQLPETNETYVRWGRIAQKFGRAGVFDPSRDQLPIFEHAVEMAVLRRDQAALVWAEYWLGYINYALGEPIAAIFHCERALDAALGIDDGRLVAQIRAALGQTMQASCDYASALPLLDEAIEVKRRSRTGDGPLIGIAYSLSCKAFALGDMGRFAEAHAYFEEAMAAIGGSRRELEASVLDQRSAVCLWHGRMEDALRYAEEAERIGERIRSLYDFAMSRALAGYARWKMERAPAAVQMIVEATSWLEESGRNQCISLAYGWLAEAMVDSGRIEDARRYAARALVRARRHDRMGEAMALRAMARAAAQEERHQAVGRYLARALQSARNRGSPHEVAVTQLCEAELALAAGDRQLASARLEQARQAFAALDMAWHDGQASRLAADADR